MHDPAQARYVASGELPGTLLNSYALSAADGRLRVATTEISGGTTDSGITVLEPHGGRLVPVGRVRGLGVGERIYAVRYLGDTAYVVTFRETDPLYAVDLSDPTRPAVRSELKLPGVSTHLLPLSDSRLLGIGTSGDERFGTRLSLFDVRDLGSPRLVHETVVPGTSPLVSNDPHALLSWPPAALVVVPVLPQAGGGAAAAVRTSDDLPVVGWLGGSRDGFPVTRAVVADNRIFAVSAGGVSVSRVATLGTRSWLPW